MSKRSHTNSPSPLSLSINRNCSHIKSFLAEKFKTEPTQSPNHPSPRTQWARSYRVNIARSSSCSKILIFHVPNRRSCKKPDSTVPMIYRCAWAWTALTPEIVKAWVVLEKLDRLPPCSDSAGLIEESYHKEPSSAFWNVL